MAEPKSKRLSRLVKAIKMKKILTILLALAMVFSVGMSTTTAMAKDPIISPETTVKNIVIKVTLNGETSNHTSFKPDPNNPNIITFTYTGDGILVGWEYIDGVEGVDYIILSQDENSITIQILPAYKGETIWMNAIDEYPDESTTKDDKKPTDKSTTVKKDDSTKSPNTGAATGLGIAGAGLAILIATRKKK